MAEFDDLVQEGLINVWERLQLGTKPKAEYIRRRMLDWARYCDRLARGDTITYEAAMHREVIAD